ALAFLAHPSHIPLYAPGDSLRRRLAAKRNAGVSVLFRLSVRSLSRLPPCHIPNYFGKQRLIAICFPAACLAWQNEMLEYRFSAISGFHVLRLKHYKIVRQMARSAHHSGTYS
ncbi:hypothetical protein ACMSW1_004074, partial [Cronobacter dublinensis]